MLDVSPTTITRWEQSAEMAFPQRHYLGESNQAWRKVYYLEDEVLAWIELHFTRY
jgi:predicted DNA-binding transcriptional regulator AlpA